MNSVRFLMKHFHLFLLIIFLPFGFSVLAQSNETTPVLVSSSHADTWVAKDAIGRKIEPNEKVGIRKNKYVGIFYFVWQGAHGYDHYLPDSVGANPSEGVRQKLRSDTLNPHVKTAKPLTSRDSPNWMRLFISIKDSKRPLWAGFQYLVNRAPASDSITEIEECTGGWNWRKIATISYRTQGNKLEMIIPKKIVGITGNVFTLDFKWSDNSPLDGNPMDWLDKGDTAPNGRFAYRYIHQ